MMMMFLFLVKKENVAQSEFDDLDSENMGFSHFTINMFRVERFHFDRKKITKEGHC